MKVEYTLKRKGPIPEIVYIGLPIDSHIDDIAEAIRKDKDLISAICEYRKDIEREGKYVYGRRHNMIMTDEGYIFALYETVKK